MIITIPLIAFTSCKNTATDIVILDKIEGKLVTIIDSEAFVDVEWITNGIIPEGVTTIGGYAFYNCTSLEDINIPDNITYIGTAAFCDWGSLPEGIEEKILQINPRDFTDPIFDDDYE